MSGCAVACDPGPEEAPSGKGVFRALHDRARWPTNCIFDAANCTARLQREVVEVRKVHFENSAPIFTPEWADADFFAPGFSANGCTSPIPGAVDGHRQLFLVRAARVEPDLLATLRQVPAESPEALQAWGKSWGLTDPWCLVLARVTSDWYRRDPSMPGWQFEGKETWAGSYGFKIEPLWVGPFRHHPTWFRRSVFKQWVLARVSQALDDYCDRIDAEASASGLKRMPRKKGIQHFDWLARYQVRRESFADIARNAPYRFAGGRQTVRKAVVELAKYLCLALRSST
jgi:hypothetical protein